MQVRKSNYINPYACVHKLLPFLIFCFLFACSEQNKTKQILLTEDQIKVSGLTININTASATELIKLPHIGEQTAREIIEHRAEFGRFRRPEHLMFVRGISNERFQELKHLVNVE